jgi:hypothetical protein
MARDEDPRVLASGVCGLYGEITALLEGADTGALLERVATGLRENASPTALEAELTRLDALLRRKGLRGGLRGPQGSRSYVAAPGRRTSGHSSEKVFVCPGSCGRVEVPDGTRSDVPPRCELRAGRPPLRVKMLDL